MVQVDKSSNNNTPRAQAISSTRAESSVNQNYKQELENRVNAFFEQAHKDCAQLRTKYPRSLSLIKPLEEKLNQNEQAVRANLAKFVPQAENDDKEVAKELGFFALEINFRAEYATLSMRLADLARRELPPIHSDQFESYANATSSQVTESTQEVTQQPKKKKTKMRTITLGQLHRAKRAKENEALRQRLNNQILQNPNGTTQITPKQANKLGL